MKEPEENFRLRWAITKRFGSVKNLCQTWPGCKGNFFKVLSLISCTVSPLLKNGSYCPVAAALSEATGILPEKLFPTKLYADVLPRGIAVVAHCRLSAKMARHLGQPMTPANDVEADIDNRSLNASLGKVLCNLSQRERETLRLRFGLGDGYTYTFEEIGRILQVTPVRARTIERKAICKLQQPSRTSALVGFVSWDLKPKEYGLDVPVC